MKMIPPFHLAFNKIPLFNADDEKTVNDAYSTIEYAARICYKSGDIYNQDLHKTKEFLDKLYKSGHFSVFEHSNYVLAMEIPKDCVVGQYVNTILEALGNSKFLDHLIRHNTFYIGGNLRAWLEALDTAKAPMNFSKYSAEYIKDVFTYKCIQHGVKVKPFFPKEIPFQLQRFGTTIFHDRAFTHELVRHRVMSFSQESQRYCNYSLKKFNNSISFVLPERFNNGSIKGKLFKGACWIAEKIYMTLTQQCKVSAQFARAVLPNACMTCIYISGSTVGWEHLFELRCASGAHPDMREMMLSIQQVYNIHKSRR